MEKKRNPVMGKLTRTLGVDKNHKSITRTTTGVETSGTKRQS